MHIRRVIMMEIRIAHFRELRSKEELCTVVPFASVLYSVHNESIEWHEKNEKNEKKRETRETRESLVNFRLNMVCWHKIRFI